MAPLASPSRQQLVAARQSQAFSRSALKAREALVRSAPRCRAGEPAAPYLRRCIQATALRPLLLSVLAESTAQQQQGLSLQGFQRHTPMGPLEACRLRGSTSQPCRPLHLEITGAVRAVSEVLVAEGLPDLLPSPDRKSLREASR